VEEGIGINSLLDMCHNLAAEDKQSQKVRFVQLLVQEYLENMDDFTVEKASSMAAEYCLSVLLSEAVTIYPLLVKAPDYSVCYWMEHVFQCNGSRKVLDLSRRFLGTGGTWSSIL
jgi:hypothetical protein